MNLAPVRNCCEKNASQIMNNKISLFLLCYLASIGCTTSRALLVPSFVVATTAETRINPTSTEISTAGLEGIAGKLLLSDLSAIYLSDPLGQQIEKVVTLSEPARSMALSPDGKRLAYFDPQDKLFIHDFDTGQVTQPNLPFLSNPDFTLEWSSNGTELVF